MESGRRKEEELRGTFKMAQTLLKNGAYIKDDTIFIIKVMVGTLNLPDS